MAEIERKCDHRTWRVTKREIEVLATLAAGYTSEQTAAELNLSVHTVIRHVSNMQARSGAPNRLWLVARAFCAGVFLPGIWPPTPSGVRCLECSHSPHWKPCLDPMAASRAVTAREADQ